MKEINSTEIFKLALGLEEPWFVEEVKLYETAIIIPEIILVDW
jgi:hypothetical protein